MIQKPLQKPRKGPRTALDREGILDKVRELGRRGAALKRRQSAPDARAVDRVLAEHEGRRIEAQLCELKEQLTSAPAAREKMIRSPMQVR